MLNAHAQMLPRIPRDTLQDMSDASVKHILPYLDAKTCPLCQGALIIDRQPESVFAFCDRCHEFDVSIHLDVESKAIVLGYSSLAGPEGFVDPDTLNALGTVLMRKEYSQLK